MRVKSLGIALLGIDSLGIVLPGGRNRRFPIHTAPDDALMTALAAFGAVFGGKLARCCSLIVEKML